MSVVPKHKDPHARYDGSQELTADQLHRFGKVANKAQKRRELREQGGTLSSAAKAVKDKALKPVVAPKKDKPNSVRYAAWMLVVMSIGLWVMFMTR
ncbi:hypothetical protein GCM10007938_25490 [Vibrio zhanjiangensis]|uniref:Stress-associated endoplasmic reticulum protein n=1 Tax=Vibrio zhanjiangensis TaxID=1046128 RepID=A0ABQ6EZV4_9VIBR|nr:hypothetical protein [Vibrio zhanjiangensis]GLT18768.1 hypothetical protein GCM10007938_25490 [Vibrio zhanjiangensis]